MQKDRASKDENVNLENCDVSNWSLIYTKLTRQQSGLLHFTAVINALLDGQDFHGFQESRGFGVYDDQRATLFSPPAGGE